MVAVMAIGLLLVYSVAEPKSLPGQALFHIQYAVPSTRPAFLARYHQSLRDWEGGYLSRGIDRFLVARLRRCEGTEEFDAIINFQLNQGSGRWSRALVNEPVAMRIKVIDWLIQRLDAMPSRKALSAMILAETMRRGTMIHKGRFFIKDEDDEALARNRFKSWWLDSEKSPEERLKENPITGTDLTIWELN